MCQGYTIVSIYIPGNSVAVGAMTEVTVLVMMAVATSVIVVVTEKV